jgi:hypothetical protein
MNATILTVARLAAIKAVKRYIQAQGRKLAYIERRISSRLPIPIFATIPS